MCLKVSYKKKIWIFCILKVTEERSQIRNQIHISQRYRSGEPDANPHAPKCHGSPTLTATLVSYPDKYQLMSNLSKEVSITLLPLDPLNSNKNLHNFELLIFGSWTLFLDLIEYEDHKKFNFLRSLSQIESFYYYEFVRWLIIWVEGFLDCQCPSRLGNN